MPTNEFVKLSVSDDSSMRAYVSRPSGEAKQGIIVLQEAFGVNPYIRSVADRLAAEGFLAIAPELFHRSGGDGFEAAYGDYDAVRPQMAAMTDAGLEADLQAAHAWLLSEGDIASGAVSAIGFCMGGSAAFIADAILPLKSAVSFYGGRTAKLLSRVPDLHAPILYFWGGLDAHIPAADRRAVVDAMVEHKKSYADVTFSDADHGFFCDARHSFHKKSAELAWPMTLEFLKG